MLALTLRLECSDIALRSEEMPTPEGYPGDGKKVVAAYIKGMFKGYASYDSFEISDFHWVHSIKGWAWLVCVRFQDRGHARTYALFIKDGVVLDSRYAVLTDACNTQAYAPFNEMGPMRPGVLEPLH